MKSVATIGSKYLTRCSPPTQAQGCPTVFANGKAVATIGDRTTLFQEIVPCKECCKPHTGTIIKGSAKVFAGGKAVATIGDECSGITGNIPILEGSFTVFAA